MKVIGLICMLALPVVLGGCASSGVNAVKTPPQNQSVAEEKYKIGPGDVLSISVWDNPDLTSSVPVRPDGYISLPLAGDIKADGLDAETLAKSIMDDLGAQLRNPQVTVIVSQVNSAFVSRVRVTGAVNSPISINYGKGMSILDLVLEAGGLNAVAAGSRAKLYRQVDGKLIEVIINLDDILLRGKMETNFPLQPGDVLTVPERLF
jgi:polysaccharide biosynthesis/export protein